MPGSINHHNPLSFFETEELVTIFVDFGADLFARLQTAGEEEAGRIETEIWIEWSKSGSPAMDLLLQRGRDAHHALVTIGRVEQRLRPHCSSQGTYRTLSNYSSLLS